MRTRMTDSISSASSSVQPTTPSRPSACASCSMRLLMMPNSVQSVAGFGASTMRYTSALLVAGVSRAWLSDSEKLELSVAREVDAAAGVSRWSCTSTMRHPS